MNGTCRGFKCLRTVERTATRDRYGSYVAKGHDLMIITDDKGGTKSVAPEVSENSESCKEAETSW